MKTGRIARQALRSAGRYRLRAVLMMLGILIGITSLAILNSVGEATKQETMKRFKNMLGTFDTIIVRPGGGRLRGMPTLVNVPPTLRFEDADAIAGQREIKAVAQVQTAFDIDVQYRDRDAAPAVFGVSPNWLVLRSEDVADGSFFDGEQNTSLARVAVIGADVKRQLFPEQDPLGMTIRIAHVPFQVIGILRSRGAGPAGGSLDNIVLIPINTAARRLFNRDYLTMLIAQVKDPDRSTEATASISALLRTRHRIQPPALDDFTITNPAATMARVRQAGDTLNKILTGVSVMALLIGGIVIMALMSAAVSERRREIGIRRSVGAERGDIVQQFLFEAMFVALAGGVAGMLIGVGGTQIVSRMQKLPQVFLWQPVAIALLVALATGVLSGIYPAWKASRVDPIRALRS
jgi:putative ABC transport system permease protein